MASLPGTVDGYGHRLLIRRSMTDPTDLAYYATRSSGDHVTTELLWGGRPKPTRGPKPTLSLDRIADSAITIADAEGLGSVTMQRVAADLGFTKMALCRYVACRAELVALMVERAIGESPAIDAIDWRAGLKQWSHQLLAAYLRHAWALAVTVGPRPLGPNELGWMECALSTPG
ncbi:TetR/AcrR family transcriptional regulator [Micromonospora matsumotoense]|uniref:TetR/AcrR family transcriptional regulator n=1 Tax=Micromonospora matsumotoense TaxID=121616 RepID=UPI003CCBD5EE